MSQTERLIVSLAEVTLDSLSCVGGKNASLGEMIRELDAVGVRVPEGFALTTNAYHLHLREAGATDEILQRLDRLDVEDVNALASAGREIRRRIGSAPLPKALVAEARAAYEGLSQRYGEDAADVAVRSSATAEDLPTASFAGQQETFLNVRGWEELDRAIRGCMASLFTDRAIVYRREHGIEDRGVGLSVGVQKMIRSDLASAGVIFTLDTESGLRDLVLITGAWGLGESVVQGRVDPDEFWVHKETLRQGFRSIVRRELGDKRVKLVYGEDRSVREVRTSREERSLFILTEEEALQLARWAISIEDHYSKRAGIETPMDIEWAKDGRSGDLFIVQARPETIHSQNRTPSIEIYTLRERGHVLATGKSVGSKIGTGPVRIIRSSSELGDFRDGEVLVAEMTDPDWQPVMAKASALVTEHGGRTCHAAIVSREMGVPCVVGTGNALSVLREGQSVTVSCAEGAEGRVYEGALPFDRQKVDPAALPAPPVPLMLNLANPDSSFLTAQLPSAGVGLMRVEFLVNNWIGIHPMALVHPDRVASADDRSEILRRTRNWSSPDAFFVDRMASGIAVIAAGFYPRPVVVRFSDFKTNEYAGLIGGSAFEPDEANPMIGFRGASRYYNERYREGFALECRAVKRVREEMGLVNVKLMIPFCRTLEEGRRVLDEMKKNGLERGRNDLEVLVMAEIPNNVILAEEFSELFDGFSIGSNDLTQLVLGVDRDSQILSEIFDEQDPGVKRMISNLIDRAHKAGRKVGICGQGPSDHPDFAAFLVEAGIDSISLTPDSLPGVMERLARS
ncbi:MAG: phosphoenolpyruvate synthase [Deltaproteobacteria bacterium]|nr:phosphoenolpyruvate synthase [Deltaproteobacteria bacterium]